MLEEDRSELPPLYLFIRGQHKDGSTPGKELLEVESGELALHIWPPEVMEQLAGQEWYILAIDGGEPIHEPGVDGNNMPGQVEPSRLAAWYWYLLPARPRELNKSGLVRLLLSDTFGGLFEVGLNKFDANMDNIVTQMILAIEYFAPTGVEYHMKSRPSFGGVFAAGAWGAFLGWCLYLGSEHTSQKLGIKRNISRRQMLFESAAITGGGAGIGASREYFAETYDRYSKLAGTDPIWLNGRTAKLQLVMEEYSEIYQTDKNKAIIMGSSHHPLPDMQSQEEAFREYVQETIATASGLYMHFHKVQANQIPAAYINYILDLQCLVGILDILDPNGDDNQPGIDLSQRIVNNQAYHSPTLLKLVAPFRR